MHFAADRGQKFWSLTSWYKDVMYHEQLSARYKRGHTTWGIHYVEQMWSGRITPMNHKVPSC